MKKTTAILIAEEISKRIATGCLHPGEHLVETVLAEEFQTSRAPVREALLMLERDRLVQRVPHHGVIVRAFTKKEIHELYDAIYRLEEIAMEKAVMQVAQLSAPDFAGLQDNLHEQLECVRMENIHGFYELNEKFHNIIFTLAGNEVLLELYHSLCRSARPLRILTLAQGRNLIHSYEEHLHEVEALRTGNWNKGKEAIQEQERRALHSLDLLFVH